MDDLLKHVIRLQVEIDAAAADRKLDALPTKASNLQDKLARARLESHAKETSDLIGHDNALRRARLESLSKEEADQKASQDRTTRSFERGVAGYRAYKATMAAAALQSDVSEEAARSRVAERSLRRGGFMGGVGRVAAGELTGRSAEWAEQLRHDKTIASNVAQSYAQAMTRGFSLTGAISTRGQLDDPSFLREAAAAKRAEHLATKDAAAALRDLKSGAVYQLGQGQSMRRVVSQLFSGAIGGEGGIGDILSGVMGILGGSVLLRMGWMLGNQIIGAPGKVAEQVDLHREAMSLRYRAATQGNADDWRLENRKWSNLAAQFRIGDKNRAGESVFDALMGVGQKIGFSPTEATAASLKALFLGAGPNPLVSNPEDFAAVYGRMMRHHDPQAKHALVSQDWLMDAFVEKYRNTNQFRGADISVVRAAVLQDAQRPTRKGNMAITEEEIDAEIRKRINQNPYVSGMLGGQASEFRGNKIWGRQGFEFWTEKERALSLQERGVLRVLEAKLRADPSYTPPSATRHRFEDPLMDLARAKRALRAGDTGGIPGMSGEDVPAHLLTPNRMFEFTSISGLAERMQMMLSGGDDTAQGQLDEQKETNRILRERLNSPANQMMATEGIMG